ncbi:MAG: zinc dependent phospholipase C family protein [Clostridia bacterium]|nr:zinc dependent phospholipase C family protein [Clostridia bacterium]
MPAIYAHKRFGERIFEFLPTRFKDAFEPYKDCFLLGLVGPDLLFYHQPFKANQTRKKALELHYLPAKDFFVSAAKKICSQSVENYENTALAAYTAGFICHFTLDNACHPRVYELEDTGVSHGRIESEFDKYILRREDKQVFGKNHSKHLKASKRAVQAGASILDVKQDEVRRSVRTLKLINGVFSCRFKFVHRLVHALLKKMNMQEKYSGMLFFHEDEKGCLTINADLYKDLEDAIPLGVESIAKFFEDIETTAQTGAIDNIFDKDYRGGIIHE